MHVQLSWIAMVLGVCLSAAADASARYALVVGVSEYPYLEPQFTLCKPDKGCGPRNDVLMIRQTLSDAGYAPEDISLLADGVDGATLPTRENIAKAFESLAARVQPGDHVYIHMSGHGSQQPATAASDAQDRAYGYDQIFLPRDTKGWKGDKGAVENAIIDNELSVWVTALRRKGAFVWSVFDSCHSGTMMRGGRLLADVAYRTVPPDRLGIPQASGDRQTLPQQVAPTMLDAADSGEVANLGGYITFYAAQPHQLAPQATLPNASGHQAGVLTFFLNRAVADNPGITYRQLMQQIEQDYKSVLLMSVSPYIEGTALDAPVFSDDATVAGAQQWKVTKADDRFDIRAGQLQRVTEGSVLAMVARPTDGLDKAIGHLRVIAADLMSATAEPVPYGQQTPAPAMDSYPRKGWVRLVESAIPVRTTVSGLPRAAEQGAAPDVLRQALAEIAKDADAQRMLAFVETDETADVHLRYTGERLWFLADAAAVSGAESGQGPSVGIADKSAAQLADDAKQALLRIARVRSLARFTQWQGPLWKETELKVEVSWVSGDTVQTAELDTKQSTVLHANDIVGFRVCNTGARDIDATLLFIGSDYSITPIYTTAASGRLGKQDCSKPVQTKLAAETVGAESVLLIATPAVAGGVPQDFSFLAQDGIPRNRGANPVAKLITQLAYGEGQPTLMRGETKMADVAIRTLTWETSRVPRGSATSP